MRERVGEFFVHLVSSFPTLQVQKDQGVLPASALLTQGKFLCVCVDFDEQVAKGFGRMFQFRHVINALIPGPDFMPVGYGQLGCSGFVIVDGQGCFVTRKSMSFLNHGEDAFADVERILRGLAVSHVKTDNVSLKPTLLVGQEESYMYSIGKIVMIDTSHDRPELVGKEVKILAYDQATQRYRVQLVHESRGEVVHVMPCCLAPLSQDKKANNHNNQKDTSTTTKKPTDSIIDYPATVGVVCMDDEHKTCVDAINAMLLAVDESKDTGPTPALLQRVLSELEDHFEHEEALMRQYYHQGSSTNGQPTNFSALASHVADHQNILEIARNELARVANDSITCVGNMCSQKHVRPHIAQKIAQRFVEHAERFDSLYSSHIPTDCT